jgi:sulfur-carrier protein
MTPDVSRTAVSSNIIPTNVFLDHGSSVRLHEHASTLNPFFSSLTRIKTRHMCQPAMPSVHLTRHLFTFFPQLEGQDITVEASTVGEVVQALERLAPGIGFYICDERGRLRTHVNIFVGKQMIRDRKGLTDAVTASDEVHILQALSGG